MKSPRGDGPVAYRADIDGLRALAVGLVLLFHGFPAICRSGFIGVDVFFVISGYLITRILLQRRDRFAHAGAYIADFYRHRIRRIFPALIVVLVAGAVYGWFRLFPADYASLTKYIAAGAGFVSNFVLATESGYFDAGTALKPLTHLWSLAIEEQFYLVWPLVIWFVSRVRAGRFVLPVLGVLTAASFVVGLVLTAQDPTAAYYSPLSRGWELGVGGILAALHARGRAATRRPLNEVISAIALILIPVGAFTFIDSRQFPGWQALVPVLATAALVWFGSGTFVDRRILGTRPVVWIGLISYPLYLWHWVLLSFLRIEWPAPPGIVTLGALGVSVALAAATYYLIERPLRSRSLARTSLVGLIAMGVILAYGLAASLTGFSGVTLTPTQQALSRTYDPRPDYRFGSCFLDSATQTGDDFAAECDPSPGSRRVLLLWGDSLVAQLYPGLDATRDDHGYVIAQRTATSCPAAVGAVYPDRGGCDDINASTRAAIEAAPPDTVVIDGRWPEDAGERRTQIGEVVSFLRDAGVRSVVVVGPTPDWYPDLRGILIRETFPGDVLPDRAVPPGTLPATLERDADLRRIAAESGAEYLSLADLLCDGDQCLIRVSDDIPDGLITSDHDHLTAQASVYVWRRIANSGFWVEQRG